MGRWADTRRARARFGVGARRARKREGGKTPNSTSSGNGSSIGGRLTARRRRMGKGLGLAAESRDGRGTSTWIARREHDKSWVRACEPRGTRRHWSAQAPGCRGNFSALIRSGVPANNDAGPHAGRWNPSGCAYPRVAGFLHVKAACVSCIIANPPMGSSSGASDGTSEHLGLCRLLCIRLPLIFS
jgi:hypothetical protein